MSEKTCLQFVIARTDEETKAGVQVAVGFALWTLIVWRLMQDVKHVSQ